MGTGSLLTDGDGVVFRPPFPAANVPPATCQPPAVILMRQRHQVYLSHASQPRSTQDFSRIYLAFDVLR